MDNVFSVRQHTLMTFSVIVEYKSPIFRTRELQISSFVAISSVSTQRKKRTSRIISFLKLSGKMIKLTTSHLGPSKKKITRIVSLLDLPEEIISHIMSFVDREGLGQISLCSRTLQRIALPYLYRHVILYEKYDEDPTKHTFRDLGGLTSLFLRRPDYASLVRHLTIMNVFESEDESSNGEKKGRHIETMVVDEAVKKAIKESSHSEHEEKKWLGHASCSDSGDALLAIMLPALVRLEVLDIDWMESMAYFTRTLERIVCKEKPFDTQPALTTLAQVTHKGWSYHFQERDTMDPRYISLFLHLPAMRALHALAVGPNHNDGNGKKPVATLQTGLSNLTHLGLVDSVVHLDNLRTFLRVSNNLKTFLYKVGYTPFVYVTQRLQEALEPVEKCLENLWLDRATHSEAGAFTTPDRVKPMNFSSFTSLTSLHIESVLLYGDPLIRGSLDYQKRSLRGVFPPGLQTLEIIHRGFVTVDLLNGLEDLLQGKQIGTDIANLKQLTLVPYPWVGENTQERTALVVVAAMKAGVAMAVERRMIHTPMHNLLVQWEDFLWGGRDARWMPVVRFLGRGASVKDGRNLQVPLPEQCRPIHDRRFGTSQIVTRFPVTIQHSIIIYSLPMIFLGKAPA